MEPTNPVNLPNKLIGEIKPDSPLQGLPSAGVAVDDRRVMQGLATAYITTMYYSALSNLYIQSLLPRTLEEVDAEMPRLKIAFNRSFADYTAAAAWLSETGRDFIDTSTARALYEEVQGLDSGAVKDITGFYS